MVLCLGLDKQTALQRKGSISTESPSIELESFKSLSSPQSVALSEHVEFLSDLVLARAVFKPNDEYSLFFRRP